MTSFADMEKARAAMTSNSGNIDHLVTSAPDDALLQMLKQLKLRLDDLESESGTTAKVKDVGDIVFDSQLLTRLKSDLSELGDIQKPHQQTSATACYGGFFRENFSGYKYYSGFAQSFYTTS
ncbi:uncharacterized protein [Littorina saxatilis]|uniref:uncharacterized protein n=1 Tax=Littorina saxatilis TaxID=31220 RepID=UPI0038B588DB